MYRRVQLPFLQIIKIQCLAANAPRSSGRLQNIKNKSIQNNINCNCCQYDMHKPRPSSSTLSIIRAVLYNISLTAS